MKILFMGDADTARKILAGPPANITSSQIAEALKVSATTTAPTVAGTEAVIPIQGLLSPTRDYWGGFVAGGNTVYGDIVDAITAANADPRVKSITLSVGYSPGGYMHGSFEAYDAVRNSAKPVTAVVRHGALSSAYGLVSQASEVVAFDESTEFGSVGVAATYHIWDHYVDIASTKAPEKRPDLRTEEGKAIVRKELDAAHDLFVGKIAAGRKVDASTVNSTYGAGGIVFAKSALAAGMIDKIGGLSVIESDKSASVKSGAKEVTKVKDLEELKTQYPAIYRMAFNEGVKSESDRVSAHLELGEACGDIKIAIESVKEGKPLDAVTQSRYMAASMRSNIAAARQADNPELQLSDGASGEDNGLGAKVADLVCARRGASTDEGWGGDE